MSGGRLPRGIRPPTMTNEEFAAAMGPKVITLARCTREIAKAIRECETFRIYKNTRAIEAAIESLKLHAVVSWRLARATTDACYHCHEPLTPTRHQWRYLEFCDSRCRDEYRESYYRDNE
jgi:hypothetical protein